MADTPLGSLNPCIDTMANRSALHEDDGMMSVLSGDCRGQTHDVPRFRPPGDKLEARCGQVMTFIDNQVTEISDHVRNFPIADETLDERDINDACRLSFSATNNANLFRVNVQKGT